METIHNGWIGTSEAAQRLGVTSRTVYRLIDKDALPAYRFGRVIRLRVTDLAAYIDRCRISPGELRHLAEPPRPEQE